MLSRTLPPPNWGALAASRISMLVGIWGDLGVGKSHLVRGWLQTASIRTLSLKASASLPAHLESFGSWRGPTWAVRRLERTASGEPTEVGGLADAVAALLVNAAPLAVHFEDTHEASPNRLAFLSGLARALRHARGVAVILSGRTPPPEGYDALKLESLTREAADHLLETNAAGALPDAARDWIWMRARGNPLFTLEYFQFLTRQGDLWSDGSRWRWREPRDERLPNQLDGLLARVLELASGHELARVALEVRGVLPAEASLELWHEVSGLIEPDFSLARAELERHGVLNGPDFAHPLYREVMQSLIPPARRQALARRALECLEARFDGWDAQPVRAEALMAARLVEMAQLPSDHALSVLERAAATAFRAGDPVRAARLDARAVEYASGTRRAGLALCAAQALRQTDLREALRLAEVARQDQPIDPETVLLCAELRAQSGEVARAQELIDRFPSHQTLEISWWPRLIGLRTQQLDFQGVLDLWRTHPERQPGAGVLVRRDVAWAMMQFGELDVASTLLEDAAGSPNATVHERALVTSAHAYLAMLQGRPDQAERLADAAISVLSGEGVSRDLARALELRAEALEQLGQFAEAATSCERAIRLRAELGDGWGVSRAQLRLASALTELAEYTRAEELLLEGRRLPERAEATDSLIVWDCQLAHLYLEWAAPHTAMLALRHARRALELVRAGTSPMLENMALAQAALTEAHHGDAQMALGLADQALGLARKMGQADHVAIEMSARGAALEALGRPAEALEAFREAERMLRASGILGAERAALELDRLTNDAQAARMRLEHFEQRGHRHAANLARRYFPQLEVLQETSQDVLELCVLGNPRLRRSSKELRLNLGSGQRLLARLLEARLAGRQEVGDLELCDAFWPELPENRARAALKNLVYRLRERLGAKLIHRTSTGYALGEVQSDAEHFLHDGDGTHWRGVYLGDQTESWEPGVRARLTEALRVCVQTTLERDPREALRLARILGESEPYDTHALELTCRALHLLGNRRDLAKIYALGRERMLEVGETLPESWHSFLSA